MASTPDRSIAPSRQPHPVAEGHDAARRGRSRPVTSARGRGRGRSAPPATRRVRRTARCRACRGRARSVRAARRPGPRRAPVRRVSAAAPAPRQGRRRSRRRARDVAQHADRVVVVEVAAEALVEASAAIRTTIPLAYWPAREEAQRRRLAAQLVLGVVEVGEVLDLRDGQQPGQGGAERQPEDRLLVEQGVEDACRPEALLQPERHAVDAALDPDVLTRARPPAGRWPGCR